MEAKGNAEMVAAAIRTIFAQPDAEHVEEQFDVIAGMLGRQLPISHRRQWQITSPSAGSVDP